MPTDVLFAETNDGWWRLTSASSWDAAQGSSTTDAEAGSAATTAGYYSFSVYNRYTGGRGGNKFYCSRSLFQFDLSSLSGTVTAGVISLYLDHQGSGSGTGDVRLVAAHPLNGDVGDYGRVYSSGTTFDTAITDAVSVSTTAGYHTFTLNSAGISWLNGEIGSGKVSCGLVGESYDYGETAPNLGGDYTQIEVHFTNYSGTDRDPKISIVTGAAAVTHNATFFGANF